ncbi:MAG: hypothetical protein K0Q73_3902, partial [Paenibacillus sp.]|nr:hypothetical protein [Paenibacillus sp.]
MKKIMKWVLIGAIIMMMLPAYAGPASAETLQYTEIPLSNPGFEETIVQNGKTVPKLWLASLWSRTSPVNSGITTAEQASGTNAAAIPAVDLGSAGWTSSIAAVADDVQALRLTFKVKKSADYAGNVPWAFISYWDDGSFIGTSVAIVSVNAAAWTEITLTVNRSQFSVGTNRVRVNLATSRHGTSANLGSLYYDDVKLEAGMPTDIIDVPNPSFEETTVKNGVTVPVSWVSSLWSRTTPVDTGITTTEAAYGVNALYLSTTDAGAAGWTSPPIMVTGGSKSIKTTVKLKKSADFEGNTPWIFISYWNDGTFLGTAKAPVLNLSTNWSDQSFTVKSNQFPAGTNQIRLHLATLHDGSNASNQGMLYYDAVSMELVEEVELQTSTFANWWKLGDPVVFHLADGQPTSVLTVSGTVYDTDNQVVTQITVDRQTLMGTGWRWTPNRLGYYEIAFTYTKQGVNQSIPLTESYMATSPKGVTQEFVRNRKSIAVVDSQPKSMSERNPMFGFSYQLEGEQAMRTADLVGFSFARIHSVPWGSQFTTTSWALEPQRDVYNWTAFDQQMNLLDSYGYEIVGNILYTPQWASSHPE